MTPDQVRRAIYGEPFDLVEFTENALATICDAMDKARGEGKQHARQHEEMRDDG